MPEERWRHSYKRRENQGMNLHPRRRSSSGRPPSAWRTPHPCCPPAASSPPGTSPPRPAAPRRPRPLLPPSPPPPGSAAAPPRCWSPTWRPPAARPHLQQRTPPKLCGHPLDLFKTSSTFSGQAETSLVFSLT